MRPSAAGTQKIVSPFKDRTVQMLLGCMSVLGMACGLIGLAFVNHTHQKIRHQPFYKQAFERLNQNPAALALLGPPIQVRNPSLSDERNRFETNRVSLQVPVKGRNVSANLLIEASRPDDEQPEWRLDELCLQLEQGNLLTDKKIVIHRQAKQI